MTDKKLPQTQQDITLILKEYHETHPVHSYPLDENQKAFLATWYTLGNQGKAAKVICKMVGITYAAYKKWINQHDFFECQQACFKHLQERILLRVDQRILHEALTNPDPRWAKMVTDQRTALAKYSQPAISYNVDLTVSGDDLDSLKTIIEESRRR